MKIDKDGRVLYFKEKPKGAELQAMVWVSFFSSFMVQEIEL
jgi:hypothetical protein